MDFFDTIILVLIIAAVGATAAHLWQVTARRSLKDQFRNLSEFDPADVYVGDNLAGIAIDPDRQEVALGDKSGIRILAPESIVSCEIIQDDFQIVLRLLTDDFDKPKHDIAFLYAYSKRGLTESSVSYIVALDLAETWYARIMAM